MKATLVAFFLSDAFSLNRLQVRCMGVCDYEYDEERMRLRINCMGCLYGSSIEDYEQCMARTIDKILEVKKVASIVLAKNREYEYDYEQTKLLVEVASVLEEVIR